MRMEYVLIALLFVAALFGSRRVKPVETPEEVSRRKQQAKEAEDKRFFRNHFVEGFYSILTSMIRYQGHARTDAYCAGINRRFSENLIRFIEERLANDKEGDLTLSSDVELQRSFAGLEDQELDFIKFQQRVHANVEMLRDYIFNVQKLAEGLTVWMADKTPEIQKAATGLLERIEKEVKTRWEASDKMLSDVDADPVGDPDAVVTPKVAEFRNKLVELRSKIRTDLAAKAKSN